MMRIPSSEIPMLAHCATALHATSTNKHVHEVAPHLAPPAIGFESFIDIRSTVRLLAVQSNVDFSSRTLLRQRQISTDGSSNAFLLDRSQQDDLNRRLLNTISSPQLARFTSHSSRAPCTDRTCHRKIRSIFCLSKLSKHE